MSVGNGAYSVFSVTMASGATLSSNIDLAVGWKTVYLVVPSMTSGTDIYIKAAVSSSATDGYRVMHPVVNTTSVQAHTFVIGSATSNKAIPIPNGLRNMFIEFSTAMTAASAQFKVLVSN